MDTIITDFFSHKIHSSNSDWPDKLVELAFIFNKFDGELYNRQNIVNSLTQISPRSSFVARDQSKFRDEYSAYPAYFGLYYLEPVTEGWILRITDTTKELLLREEPDVAAFLRIQLTLFQYPNGMGAAYYDNGKIRIQANARDRTLGFVKNKLNISPLRLIVQMLIADSIIGNKSLLESRITFDELFALANDERIYKDILPNIKSVKRILILARNRKIQPPTHYERRLHLLKHLDLFDIGNGEISVRKAHGKLDEEDLLAKLTAIGNVCNRFPDLDSISNDDKLIEIIQNATWGKYFDGVKVLDSTILSVLATDIISNENITDKVIAGVTENVQDQYPLTYPLRERSEFSEPPAITNRKSELADPEVTRIKRQRRSLQHKLLVDQMDNHLRLLRIIPRESQHIDLYANIPGDGSVVFEMKSGGENLLSQIRKGISQLYEYRFRYRDNLQQPVKLCLVLAEPPNKIPWIIEYICNDREINLCWVDNSGKFIFPDGFTSQELSPLFF